MKKHLIIFLMMVPSLLLAQWDGWNKGRISPVVKKVTSVPLDVGTPIAWWRMGYDDTNATQILDISGNSRHASNMPSVATGPTRIMKDGTYYYFNGGSGVFDAGDIFTNLTQTFAVSVWMQFMNQGSYCYVYGTYNGGAHANTYLGFSSGGAEVVGVLEQSDGTTFITANLPALPSAVSVAYPNWCHVVLAGDGASIKLYSNAVVIASNTYNGTLKTIPGYPFYIGGLYSSAKIFSGNLADVRVFTNLSPVQITNLYTTGRYIDYWDVVTNMTSSNAPAPSEVSGSSEWSGGSYPPWKAFDGSVGGNAWYALQNETNHWIQYDFSSSTSPVVAALSIKGEPSYCPYQFGMNGSTDGSTWTLLQTNNIPENSGNIVYFFKNNNTTAYRYYRIWITNQYSAGIMAVKEIRLFERRQ